jgi:uncharacterized protein with FMN-binding domain
MISARKLRLIWRIAGTAVAAAVVAMLVVIYIRSEGTGARAAVPRVSASSGTGGEQGAGSTGSSAAPASSGPGPCTPPRVCGSQTGSSHGSSAKVTYTGPVAENPYGPVQVQVAEEGGKIIDVKALQMPTEHALSQEISTQVAPMLRSEVLQAQSAEISIVSGATYTSESYATSLQGALRQAG